LNGNASGKNIGYAGTSADVRRPDFFQMRFHSDRKSARQYKMPVRGSILVFVVQASVRVTWVRNLG